jgi:nucleoside-diphosphate-sugar epimerase
MQTKPVRQPVGVPPCTPENVDDFLSEPNARVIDTLSRVKGPVVILGAGGKMGLHLTLMVRKALAVLKHPHPVIAVSRFKTLRDRSVFEAHGIAAHHCDLMDQQSLAALPDASDVFFLAGVKFGTASSPDVLHRANVLMPEQVAHRYRGSRIVAFSTGCVYPFVSPRSGGATEETPVAPVGDYAVSCVGREQAFEGASQKYGTAVSLIRLNYAVEFRYGTLVDIAQKVLASQPVDVSTGCFNAIWQTDALVHSIIALEVAGRPAVPVNVTGADILSVRETALLFGRLLQREVHFTGTEAATAWLNNAAKSHAQFGSPATRVEDMIVWIAAWLRNGWPIWGKPTGFERRDGRF